MNISTHLDFQLAVGIRLRSCEFLGDFSQVFQPGVNKKICT